MRSLLNFLFIISLIVIPIFLESCDTPNIPTNSTEFRYGNAGIAVDTYVINGHEYVGHLIGNTNDWASHSGTCPHPSHKCHTDTVYIPVPADTVYCVVTANGKEILKNQK